MRRPRVSVTMTTFRHERWVAQAIESVLAQDLEDWELVVGDDASDDGTVEVVERFRSAHPDRIRVLPWREKVGPRANYKRVIRAARGEFVSQLDGDDWFVPTDKLSRQVALLDANPDCATCFGAWIETDEDGAPLGEPHRAPRGRDRFALEDLGPYNLAASATVLFRRGLFGDFPAWFDDVPVGDWPLHALNALHGDIAYVDEILAAHRNHGAGVWAGRDRLEQRRRDLRTQAFLVTELPAGPAARLRARILRALFHDARELELAGRHAEAHMLLRWCREHRADGFPAPFKLWRRLRRTARAARRVEGAAR